MDTSQWPQGNGVVKTVEETRLSNTIAERKAKPLRDQIVNCPRCNSTNTKFCYYNNYSLSQPRYFCKTCRRYWTEGGSLRNVPVGGGSRKNKRSSSSSSSNSQSQNPKFNQTHDLNLAYQSNSFSKFIELPPKNPTSTNFSSMELLKNTHHENDLNITTSMGLTSFMPMPVSDNSNPIYTSLGFSMQEYKPTLNFTLDGFENGYGVTSLHNGVQQNVGANGTTSSSARLLFPFEELKQVSNASEFDHHNNNRSSNADSNGYWNGMLNGGGSW